SALEHHVHASSEGLESLLESDFDRPEVGPLNLDDCLGGLQLFEHSTLVSVAKSPGALEHVVFDSGRLRYPVKHPVETAHERPLARGCRAEVGCGVDDCRVINQNHECPSG